MHACAVHACSAELPARASRDRHPLTPPRPALRCDASMADCLPCRATDPASAEFYRRVLLGFVSLNQHATNLLFVAIEVALHA